MPNHSISTEMKLLIIILCTSVAALAQPPATQPEQSRPALKIASATISSFRADVGGRSTPFYFQNDARRPYRDNANGYYPGDLSYVGEPPQLECRKNAGDRSTIIDLGDKTWDQIGALPAQQRSWSFKAPVFAGHAYLIHINDVTAADFWAIVRVVDKVHEDRCAIEWVCLNQSERRPVPSIQQSAQEHLAALLDHQDDNVDPSLVLGAPRIVLQLRSGAGGGNPNRINMLGDTSVYVDRVSDQPLSFDAAPQMNDRVVAYFSGGRVPDGKCLVIRKVTFRGTAKGDSNGHGEFVVHLGRVDIIRRKNTEQIPETKWEGRIEVRHGEEAGVYVEVANSSAADVLVEGELVDR